MGRDSVAALFALAVLSQQTVSFHVPANPATSARSLQHHPHPTASPSRQHQHPLLPSRSLLWSPLAAEADGGGGGGFSSGEGGEKLSRKAAKKAKARGGAGPAVELKKAAGEQQVSKSLVAEVLGTQAAKEGGSTADQVAAR